MNETSGRLQLATIGALILVFVALTMNTCAMDRLEQQVIETRQSLERGGGGGGQRVVVAANSGSAAGEPGQATGYTARGWGDREAAILYVEGARPGAPLTISEKPKPQGDIYVNRRPSPPSTLNYYATSEGETSTVTQYILERLIEVDPDAPPDVIPTLAVDWSTSDDKLTYTYKLRKGVLFADGRPFTSADVKFSFDVMRDPEVKAEALRSAFDDVVEITTPDDYTVVVRYGKKYWRGIYAVGYDLRILNKGWYEEQIPRYAEKLDIAEYSTEPGKPGFGEVFNKIRVPCPGTGPYYYAEEDFDLDKPVDLLQNPFWWGTQVRPTWWNFKGMKWIYISDPVAAFEEFRKQKFDVSVVDFQAWDDEYSKDASIKEVSNYYEYDHMGIGYSYISWNTRKAPFDDPRVRKAMTYLTNRAWMHEEIERGRGWLANFPSKPIYPEYQKKEPIPYDLEAAKALLAEAGWTDSDGDGVLDKDGQPFEFEFKVPSGGRFFPQVVSVLEDACKQVGIRVTPRPLEWATFIQDFYERRFDAVCLFNSFADPWIDPYDSYHSSQDVPNGSNGTGWRNPEVDRLLEQMRETFDVEARIKLHQQFHEIFYEEQPQTLLFHSLVGVLQNKRFENVKVRPTGMRVHDVWVEPENVLYK
jgi:peptide/nickel transport system substrate-binding protein